MMQKKIVVLLCMWQMCVAQKPMVVIIPSYNNIQWYEQNLLSVFSQTIKQWKMIYIDDASDDGTVDAVRAFCAKYGMEDKCTILCNEKRQGALSNIYHVIHSYCPDNAIVITLDGDDWLAHETVFERILQEYENHDAWLTYGTYCTYPEKTLGGYNAIPDAITHAQKYRLYRWCSTHLRTFYAKLFKMIHSNDLMYEGTFFPVTWDMAFMFPMLEMASFHAHHIPEVLYIYNQATPLNDYKLRLEQILKMERIIRGKSVYKVLEKL